MNRIIVVTGGAAGIGRCIVEHFAAEGDRVYFIDNNREATLTQVERYIWTLFSKIGNYPLHHL